MSYIFEVLDPRGIFYREGGNSELKVIPQGKSITESDVLKDNFSLGGLEAMVASGRIKLVDGNSPFGVDLIEIENKKLEIKNKKEGKK